MSLWQMSVSSAVMIVVITVLRALLLERLPKRTFLVLWQVALARLLVPQAGSVLNGISYVSNLWVCAATMLEAFMLARVCPGITAFEPKE